jgi:hypothetical protein
MGCKPSNVLIEAEETDDSEEGGTNQGHQRGKPRET